MLGEEDGAANKGLVVEQSDREEEERGRGKGRRRRWFDEGEEDVDEGKFL